MVTRRRAASSAHDHGIGRNRTNLLDEAREMPGDLRIGRIVFGNCGTDGLRLADLVESAQPRDDSSRAPTARSSRRARPGDRKWPAILAYTGATVLVTLVALRASCCGDNRQAHQTQLENDSQVAFSVWSPVCLRFAPAASGSGPPSRPPPPGPPSSLPGVARQCGNGRRQSADHFLSR